MEPRRKSRARSIANASTILVPLGKAERAGLLGLDQKVDPVARPRRVARQDHQNIARKKLLAAEARRDG
jgi:hypothetical protein